MLNRPAEESVFALKGSANREPECTVLNQRPLQLSISLSAQYQHQLYLWHTKPQAHRSSDIQNIPTVFRCIVLVTLLCCKTAKHIFLGWNYYYLNTEIWFAGQKRWPKRFFFKTFLSFWKREWAYSWNRFLYHLGSLYEEDEREQRYVTPSTEQTSRTKRGRGPKSKTNSDS